MDTASKVIFAAKQGGCFGVAFFATTVLYFAALGGIGEVLASFASQMQDWLWFASIGSIMWLCQALFVASASSLRHRSPWLIGCIGGASIVGSAVVHNALIDHMPPSIRMPLSWVPWQVEMVTYTVISILILAMLRLDSAEPGCCG